MRASKDVTHVWPSVLWSLEKEKKAILREIIFFAMISIGFESLPYDR
jgi:hypothetical protein